MLTRGSIAVALIGAASGVARAQEPPSELVRPDREGPPPPPAEPPPLLTVTPPDLVPPVVPEEVWRAQRRRLKIKTGVAWTFAAIGLVGLAVPIAIFATCGEDGGLRQCPDRRGALIAVPIFGTLALASLVPAVIFTDRLIYRQRPGRAPQLGLGAAGVVLRF